MSEQPPNPCPVCSNVQQPVGQPLDSPRSSDGGWPYSWQNRRRMLWAGVLFCKLVIAYVIVTGATSSVAESAVMFSFVSLTSMIGSYVFGAAWQDVNHMRITGK